MEEEQKKTDNSVLCEVCKQQIAKYTCPACFKKTCCLECVRLHKKQDNCSGVRDRTKFVSMKDYNDKVLQDDFVFLTDIARKVDSSLKGINDFPAWNIPHMVEDVQDQKPSKIKAYNSYMKNLVNQAEIRKVHLIVLPLGMSRQKENNTRYNHNKDLIMWHIKWILSSITPSLSFTSKASELDTVGEIFMRDLMNCSSHLYPLTGKYKQIGLSGIIILLEKYQAYSDTETKSIQEEYYIVPIDKSLREILAGVTLLEFPVFRVIFPSDLSKYNIVNLPLLPLPSWELPPDRRVSTDDLHPINKHMKSESNPEYLVCLINNIITKYIVQ